MKTRRGTLRGQLDRHSSWHVTYGKIHWRAFGKSAECDIHLDLVTYERTARLANILAYYQESLTSCMPTHRSSGCSGLQESARSLQLGDGLTGDGTDDDTSDGPTHLNSRSSETS